MKTKSNFLRKLSIQNLLMVSFLSVFFLSCEKEENIVVAPAPAKSGDIIEVLKNQQITEDEDGALKSSLSRRNATFNTLITALKATGLDKVVTSSELTVFAPTDAAFEALGLNSSNIASVPGLSDILLYHVVGGKVYSYQLQPGFVPTVNGAAVEIKFDGRKPWVNNASITAKNIEAYNGVVHVINQVLLPPTKDVVDLAISFAPEFTTLVDAVVQAGLVDVLKGEGPFTIFAPTNQAFADLGIDLSTLTKEQLTSILLYHVVPGRVFSSDLSTGPVSSLNGSFYVDPSDLSIKDNGSDEKAFLIPTLLNVQGTNGVIHVIDKALLP
ncbi:MAG: fasciclin domain-containing protein [Bacteroidales bacterium]